MKQFYKYLSYGLSLVLLGGFGYAMYYDYTKVYPWGSSPFWIYIVIRGLELLVPAIAFFILGLWLQKKGENK